MNEKKRTDKRTNERQSERNKRRSGRCSLSLEAWDFTEAKARQTSSETPRRPYKELKLFNRSTDDRSVRQTTLRGRKS